MKRIVLWSVLVELHLRWCASAQADVPSNVTVTTLAGRQGVSVLFSDGVGTAATFYRPVGVAFSYDDNFALVVGKNDRWETLPLPCACTVCYRFP
jgi:hypothetical protein